MNIAQCREVLADLTYKPGWTFEIETGVFEGGQLSFKITFMAPHANGKGEVGPVSRRWPFWPDYYLSDGFLRWMASNIHWLENHEVNEWLRYQGRFLLDPHPEVADLSYGRGCHSSAQTFFQGVTAQTQRAQAAFREDRDS